MFKSFAVIMLFFQGISKREQYFLFSAFLGTVAFLVYMLVFAPLLAGIDLNKRVISKKTVDLKEIKLLADRYKELEKSVAAAERKMKKKFSLLSFLEEKTKRIGINGKIAFMRPKGEQSQGTYTVSAVELRLHSITLRQALDLVYLIENSAYQIKLASIKIKTRFSDPNLMDLSMKILAYKTG